MNTWPSLKERKGNIKKVIKMETAVNMYISEVGIGPRPLGLD